MKEKGHLTEADCSMECTYELKKDILTLTDKTTSEKLVLTKVKK